MFVKVHMYEPEDSVRSMMTLCSGSVKGFNAMPKTTDCRPNLHVKLGLILCSIHRDILN